MGCIDWGVGRGGVGAFDLGMSLSEKWYVEKYVQIFVQYLRHIIYLYMYFLGSIVFDLC